LTKKGIKGVKCLFVEIFQGNFIEKIYSNINHGYDQNLNSFLSLQRRKAGIGFCKLKQKHNDMYPAQLVMPMKAELTGQGFEDLTSPDAVDSAVKTSGTVLVVVNSVCGCAAGAARPGVIKSLQSEKKPAKLTTVFAGFDADAVTQARKYFAPYPPSSPAVALFKDGKLVHFIERHHIEGRSAEMIAENLKMAYEEYC
jgi:putative YphP/YqiW family bacilliredoxin